MKEEKLTVGERLRRVRDIAKETQQEFADHLKIGRTTLIKYESGERNPDAEFLIMLNVRYGTQPYWLLTGKGENATGEKLEPDEMRLMTSYRSLNEEDKSLLKLYLDALVGRSATSGTNKYARKKVEPGHLRMVAEPSTKYESTKGKKK